MLLLKKNTTRRNSIQRLAHSYLDRKGGDATIDSTRGSLQSCCCKKDRGPLIDVVETRVVLHQDRNVVNVPVYPVCVFLCVPTADKIALVRTHVITHRMHV